MKYEAHGYGDARITAWADITEWLMPAETSVEKPQEANEQAEVEEIFRERFDRPGDIPPAFKEEKKKKGDAQQPESYPHFRFGLGMKLPTGKHNLRDSQGVLLPARFQPGWGVTSPVIGAGCRRSFGKLRAVCTLMYEVSGGENSVDYKRADILRFDSWAYYPLSEKYSLVGGLGYSLTWIAGEDRSAGVKVKGTNGTFHSVNLAGNIALQGDLSAALLIKVPFGSSSTGSQKKLDFQCILSVTYSF